MKTLLTLITSLILSFAAFAGGTDSTSSNSPVPFQKLSNIHCKLIIVHATINGFTGNFLVDCGSEYTILNKRFAPIFKFQVGNQLEEGNTDWSGNAVTVYHAEKVSLKVGDSEIKVDVETSDIDALLGSITERAGMQVIGILGADALRASHLTIDFATSTLHN